MPFASVYYVALADIVKEPSRLKSNGNDYLNDILRVWPSDDETYQGGANTTAIIKHNKRWALHIIFEASKNKGNNLH